MTLEEYKDDFCKRCGKCKKNLEYYQSHCVEQDLIDETWWKCEESMVDKACEWLRENVNKYLYNRGGDEEYIPTCGDTLFNDFRKAMEGE